MTSQGWVSATGSHNRTCVFYSGGASCSPFYCTNQMLPYQLCCFWLSPDDITVDMYVVGNAEVNNTNYSEFFFWPKKCPSCQEWGWVSYERLVPSNKPIMYAFTIPLKASTQFHRTVMRRFLTLAWELLLWACFLIHLTLQTTFPIWVWFYTDQHKTKRSVLIYCLF